MSTAANAVINKMTPVTDVEAVLQRGLKNLWYPICPAQFVAEIGRAHV